MIPIVVQQKKQCSSCGKLKVISNFYTNDSPAYQIDKRYPVCKDCIKKSLHLSSDVDPMNEDFIHNFQQVLQQMNKPFIYQEYLSAINEIKFGKLNRTMLNLFGVYYKNIASFNYKGSTWSDSIFDVNKRSKDENTKTKLLIQDQSPQVDVIDNYNDLDAQNKKDVIRMIGYDPFEGENKTDKRLLYNTLVDYLDDSTLEDGFKLQAVITIVKAFNQAGKIDKALALITSDIEQLSTNSGAVKSLVQSKKQIIDSINSLAKDNGISVNNNHSKGKGAGTLSGIIKNLQNIGLDQADVNLFDIETSNGIKQVADISNQSILDQLKFDENDYNEMLITQREMIKQKDTKIDSLEEENRKLKKKMLQYTK